MAQRGSRKRRKQRQGARAATDRTPVAQSAELGSDAGRNGGAGTGAAPERGMSRGYARSRAKDDAVRAQLEPLRPGERPRAVTAGAIVAAIAALANLVAMAVRYDPDASQKTIQSLLGAAILVVVAVGMWRARYWAVLGMQTLLAITIVLGSLALLTAVNLAAALLVGVIVAAAGTLFWFLVKAMARIQMPPRPGADR
ncbi:MAG TPA: hypothetical protein VEX36_12095 [Thermoleophilaceae bacterium]|nr:hypothetical protein [Thermoleophilaceae bacterium]